MENYNVSPKVKEVYKQITDLPEIKKALEFIEGDGKEVLDAQIKLASIPAPTYHEREKAEAFCEYFKELGLTDIHIDKFGNALGTRKGKGNGPRIIIDAHMDTVFPIGTDLTPKFDGPRINMPGIADDTAGMACELGVIRALNAAGIETEGDLIFMGTVEEEGTGALGGMRKHMSIAKYDTGICIDGGGIGNIVFEGTGLRTCEINFHSKGGHAAGAFGKVSNSLYAAARAVVKIASIEVPPETGTIYCVSNFHAGNDAGINAVAADTKIKINYRSWNQELLEELHGKIFKAVEEACAEETARWGCDTVTWDTKQYVNVPAVSQDQHKPVIEAIYTVFDELGVNPWFETGGATNCTMGINAGMPTICIGAGGKSFGAHSLDEYFDPTDRHLGTQATLLTALMMCGVYGKTEPLAEKR